MRVGKRLRTVVANRKPASGKLLSASTKLVQDELLPGSQEARSLEDSSNQDDNNIRLLLMRAGKRLRTTAANEKPASSKLSSGSTKLALGIGKDMKVKKVLTLKTG